MTSLVTKISFDGAEIDAVLAELRLLLPDVAQRAPEVFDRLVGVIESGAELFVIELDRSLAAGTGDLVLRAKPTDGLRIVMSALRAGNLNLAIIEQAFGHGASSIAGDDHTASGGVAS